MNLTRKLLNLAGSLPGLRQLQHQEQKQKEDGPPPGLVVVKVGGSLFEDPRLGPGLKQYLAGIDSPLTLLVAGGGMFGDAVRDLDAWHNLGEEKAHWLALDALDVSKSFLQTLVDVRLAIVGIHDCRWWQYPENLAKDSRIGFLNCFLFLHSYESEFGPVPHTWEFTTDSIAALAARVANARLILLKSTDIPPNPDWREAARRGWVDAYFPTAIDNSGITVETVNFRKWLDEHFPSGASVADTGEKTNNSL